MDLELQGHVALVTAASRGLGKAAASALAQEGAKVAICARSDELQTAAQDIASESGSEVLPIQTDLTKPDQVKSLVDETLTRFGQIDILIINAGGPPPGNFLDLQPSDWEDAIQLTILSAVRLCYAVVPHMLERNSGSIVAVQSYTVKQPLDQLILSNSLRMAIIGMMKSLANELGTSGIRVNSINPAWTWTSRVESLMMDRAQRNNTSIEDETARVAKDIPLGRMGTEEEFGRTIAWLASPAAAFIHGHALMFDGGAVNTPI
jgi:3-oxoacyl-[acyl-carrier protein] reductase